MTQRISDRQINLAISSPQWLAIQVELEGAHWALELALDLRDARARIKELEAEKVVRATEVKDRYKDPEPFI